MSTTTGLTTVAGFAGRVGVKPDTVRYYERIGLLPAPRRTAAEHRRYDDSAVDLMRFIQGVQRLGLRLADIRQLVELRQTGACPCEPAASLVRQRLRQLDDQIAELVRVREELRQMADSIPGDDCPDPVLGHVAIARWLSSVTMIAPEGDAVSVAVAPVDEAGSLSPAACLFRGLGDPARLAILRHLALGEHRVVELTAHLGLAQSTVSGHLACLRDCGLVAVRPQGRASVYSLAAHPELLELLSAAERLLAVTGDAVVLCPRYGEAVAR